MDQEILFFEEADLFQILTVGGNDNIVVDSVFGSLVDGRVDGGAGFDTAVAPAVWKLVNIEN